MMKNSKIETIRMILKAGVIIDKNGRKIQTTLEKVLKRYVYIDHSLFLLEGSELILNHNDDKLYKLSEEYIEETTELFKNLYEKIFDEFYEIELGLTNLIQNIIIYGNREVKQLILPYNRKYLLEIEENKLYEIIQFALQDFLDNCIMEDIKNNRKFISRFIDLFAVINMNLDEVRMKKENKFKKSWAIVGQKSWAFSLKKCVILYIMKKQ